MLSVELESAGTAGGIAKTLEKRPEMRNVEATGSRRFLVTCVSPSLEGEGASSPRETVFVTNLIQVAVRASHKRQESAMLSKIWKL
jgi:hypothetical protein